MSRVLKRLLKWFAWTGGSLILLLTLFLTVPGIECAWRFPAEGTPWLLLKREKRPGYDARDAGLGGFRVKLFFIDSIYTIPPGREGAHWEDGIFWYVGDRWLFSAGTKVLF